LPRKKTRIAVTTTWSELLTGWNAVCTSSTCPSMRQPAGDRV
jgi:hypothetical protein